MNEKLKALGVATLTTLAIGAAVAVAASASVSGHFTHDALGAHATISGSEGGEHKVRFSSEGGTPFECEEVHYEGTTTVTTATTLAVTPSYAGCHTEGAAAGTVVIDTNGCQIVYHSNANASTHSPTAHATMTLECPAGKAVVITHPNCAITLTSQTVKGVTYTAVSSKSGKHELTLSKTLTLTSQYHSGICIFLGTGHQLSMNGSTTLAAFSTSGEQVNLTAT